MAKYKCFGCEDGPIYDQSCTIERRDEPTDESLEGSHICPYKKGRKAEWCGEL